MLPEQNSNDAPEIIPDPGEPVRHKLVAALAGLLFGPLGIHRLYLRQALWWLLPIIALPLIGYAMRQPVWFREPAFFGFALIVVIAWLQTIIICLMPIEKFNRRFNAGSIRKSSGGALPVLVAIIALMLATTLLMSVLALALEGFFMSRTS